MEFVGVKPCLLLLSGEVVLAESLPFEWGQYKYPLELSYSERTRCGNSNCMNDVVERLGSAIRKTYKTEEVYIGTYVPDHVDKKWEIANVYVENNQRPLWYIRHRRVAE